MAKGQGRMTFTNGSVCTGEWLHGMIQTEGAELVLSNGELFQIDVNTLRFDRHDEEGVRQVLKDGIWMNVKK